MTAPTQKVRDATSLRDGHRCIAGPAGCFGRLEWNHRESSGSGGRGSKAPKVTPADGVMLCAHHNQLLEADAAFRLTGLRMGWKLKRNRLMTADQVPFYDRNLAAWFLPDVEGRARHIPEVLAIELITAAGGYTTKGGRP